FFRVLIASCNQHEGGHRHHACKTTAHFFHSSLLPLLSTGQTAPASASAERKQVKSGRSVAADGVSAHPLPARRLAAENADDPVTVIKFNIEAVGTVIHRDRLTRPDDTDSCDTLACAHGFLRLVPWLPGPDGKGFGGRPATFFHLAHGGVRFGYVAFSGGLFTQRVVSGDLLLDNGFGGSLFSGLLFRRIVTRREGEGHHGEKPYHRLLHFPLLCRGIAQAH